MHSPATLPAGSPAPPSPRLYSREPAWRHALDWFERANALAAREVRLALRSPRAWLLLSLYVSILGAVVLTQFPANTQVEMFANGTSATSYSTSGAMPSSQRGQQLLQTFALAQFLGIWLLVPSLAVGALHQEREGQTLESLLLSPLSPLQIVWGKLCGVLAMTFVLLLGTLPLTSLCFLLGGVAPEDVALRFFGLLAWAMFCAGVGLYCASRTTSVTKATLQAYGLSMAGLAISCVMLGPGVALASIGFMVWVVRQVAHIVRVLLHPKADRKSDTDDSDSVANGLAVLALVIAAFLAWTLLRGQGMSMILVTALLIFPYGVYVSQIAVNAAAYELSKKIEPTQPKREVLRDMGAAWQQTLSPDSVAPESNVASPATRHASAYSNYSYAEPTSTCSPSSARSSTAQASVATAESKATYGVKDFLSEARNPIFARDLRHGIGGKSATLVRWAYCAVIATQLFMILLLGNMGGMSTGRSEADLLSNLVKMQLVLVMLACAWLGARSIAPERETQTLQQLLTLPMPASHVISGKISSVLYFSLYVLLAGLPLLLMLPLSYMMTWGVALSTIALQCAWGLLAGAWGVFCSLHCVKVRRALVWSLGGVGVGLSGAMASQFALQAAIGSWGTEASRGMSGWWTVMSPLAVLEARVRPSYEAFVFGNGMQSMSTMWLSIGVATALSVVLFTASSRAFAKLARQG
jgi:ABC-type transport system involved in multi-copper enzyme maturation permease subunit